MTSLSTEVVTGDGRVITVGDITQYYRNLVSLPVPSQGKIQRLGDNDYSLTVRFNSVDCDTLGSTRNFKVYSLSTAPDSGSGRRINSVRCVSDGNQVAEILKASSENGRFMARLKSGGQDSSKTFLEIWDSGKHLKTIDTSELDHGSINSDPHLGSFVWTRHAAQDKLLYVCQSKKPKSMSFFKETPKSPVRTDTGDDQESSSKKRDSDPKRGEEFLRKEDWGEGLSGIEHTMVAVLDVGNDMQITTIDVEGQSLGSPQWLDNGTKIVSVAYAENPRRLGLLDCNGRPSKLMVHDWQSQRVLFEFASDKECFHSPRASNASNKFLYLSNPMYGVHRHSVSMSICDIRTGTNTLLTSEVFLENLPSNPFTSNDNHVLFTKSDHLFDHMCLYDIESSKSTTIKFPNSGMSVLDFRNDIILAVGSEINATPTLYVAAINPRDTGDVVAWHQIEDCIHMDEMEYDTVTIPTSDESSFVSALMVKPVLSSLRENYPGRNTSSLPRISDESLPTVVRIHGGPHTAYSVFYSHFLALNARLGLKTLSINYRGSTGVSEDYTQSLCGNVGQQDVEDCLTAIRYFVKSGAIDATKLIVQGASHGGFLACHLSCQDEFKFTSVIIMNPVVDISSMHAVSDRPDWAYTEVLGEKTYEHTRLPTSQELVEMLEASPIVKHNEVSAPTLMMLGSKDQSVPMFQGLRWVDLLRARGVETQCKVYPDGHTLSKPDVAADATVTHLIWMLKHLPTS